MSYSNKKITTQESLPAIPDGIRAEFGKVLKVQTVSSNEHRMHYFLTRWLNRKKLSWKYDPVGNIIVTKGQADWYPCIVAHMDTVHSIVPSFRLIRTVTGDDHTILYAKNGKKKTGIGGDDKCGIYSVLYMLERFENIKAVFFTQEESGCKGSGAIDLSELDDVGYVIQLDRWGRGDFICKDNNTDFVNESFQEGLREVKSDFGYKDAEGLVTDSVKLFRRGIGVSCINLSCGYYQHHTDSEKIDLNQFWNAIRFTEQMIETLGCNLYEKDNKARPKAVTGYGSYDAEDDYSGWSRHKGTGGVVWKSAVFTPKTKSLLDMPIEEARELENEEFFTILDSMPKKDQTDFWEKWNDFALTGEEDYSWMKERFIHIEYSLIDNEKKNYYVNSQDLVQVFKNLLLEIKSEQDFDDILPELKDHIGEDYFLFYEGVLFDATDDLYYGNNQEIENILRT